ncbi:hypothetical protein [Oligoflexus tunisiensis]|uniref:hypothetical protein n=1 Tax=Oligoflexus tunisiensis TaxID=708132 RepID=UPI00114CFCAF|nr:hypothetical protein [Oligoflexus tunisiensis]
MRIIVAVFFVSLVFSCQKPHVSRRTSPSEMDRRQSDGERAQTRRSALILNDDAFHYEGAWQAGPEANAYKKDNRWARRSGDLYTIRFEGDQIALYGAIAPHHGHALVTLDDGSPTRINFHGGERLDNTLVYLSPKLTMGSHTLTVQATGTGEPQSLDTWITADRAVIFRDQDRELPPPEHSYPILNNSVLGYRIPRLTGKEWNIELPLYGDSVYTEPLIKQSAAHYGGLADSFDALAWIPQTFEWDYNYHHGRQGGYPRLPTDRKDAWQLIQDHFLKMLDEAQDSHAILHSLTGHYFYSHYAARWGKDRLDLIQSEIGENIRSTNARVAFTRGAARQYGKPWGLQFSPWYGPSILDYSTQPIWIHETTGEPYSGPTHGHSVELAKRSYFLTYMAGANVATMEAASINWFHGETLDAQGNLFLSPLGKVGQFLYDYTHRFPDRGIPYTPVAIVISEYHGLGMDLQKIFHGMGTDATGKKIPTGFEPGPGDHMIRELFNTVWPQSFAESAWDESKYFMTQTPFGELFDVLTEDVTADVLKHYPVVVLAGDLEMDAERAERLKKYVFEGGTLVLNSAYVQPHLSGLFSDVNIQSSHPVEVNHAEVAGSLKPVAIQETMDLIQVEAEGLVPLITGKNSAGESLGQLATLHVFGAGRVITTMPQFLRNRNLWNVLLSRIQQELQPFRVDEDIQQLFNRTSDGWIVTLINNNGVTKAPLTAAVIDPTQIQNVSILDPSGPGRWSSVREEMEDREVAIDSAGQITLAVPSGDVRILRFREVKNGPVGRLGQGS